MDAAFSRWQRTLALFAFFAISQSAHAAQSYGGIPEKFFSFIAAGKTAGAVDYVYSTNPWLARNVDQAANLKAELGKLDKLVGKYAYHEVLVEQKAGTRYVHIVYLVGYERQPLRFELRLYRPQANWSAQGVSFDAKLIEEIDKAANQGISKSGG